MNRIGLFIVAMLFTTAAFSQLYMTRTGQVMFFSEMPLENIKAENKQVYAVIDAAKKNVAFTLLMKSFAFRKELMQQHFNENYVESDKYPKASFSGTYTGDVNTGQEGVYPVVVKGNLTLHNVTRQVEVPGTLEVVNKRLVAKATFELKPEDFNIAIPSLVRDKIARAITVHVMADCSFLK